MRSKRKQNPRVAPFKMLAMFGQSEPRYYSKTRKKPPNRYDVKKEVFEMIRRREQQGRLEPRDDLIRVNRRTYEVNKDRNGRTLYAPILPNGKLEISFSVET